MAARHGPGPAGVHADEQKHSTVVPQGVITSGLRTVVPALLAGAEAADVQSAALTLILSLSPSLSLFLSLALALALTPTRSLLGLGKCITLLAQGAGAPGGQLVPYRDSTLTLALTLALTST